MLKVILLLLIISATVVDARARRKRRQISPSSYYISNVNPYSPNFNPNTPLTHPSGSFYSAPNYGYPNTDYTANQPYNTNEYVTGINPYGLPVTYNSQYPFGTSGTYQYPSLGSTYGSGLWGYGVLGFSNQYPNWMQGNNHQYYTGGTGNGLTNAGLQWNRRSGNAPFQDQVVENIEGFPPVNPNLLARAPNRLPNN